MCVCPTRARSLWSVAVFLCGAFRLNVIVATRKQFGADADLAFDAASLAFASLHFIAAGFASMLALYFRYDHRHHHRQRLLYQ